ncbi:unnamed protein product [Rotaria sordida]|uniref:Uncharacterized protein n=1 Tax=Rotaria sordida TaxID=392033 RepID=A0A814Q3G2_9BILA|nr:unnamed protein product [Rotaria sordida]
MKCEQLYEDGHGSRVGRAAAIVEVLGGFGDKGKINGVPITPIIGGALGIAFGLAITAGCCVCCFTSIFASYHYISRNYYGPYYMTLEFYPEADNIVYGKGIDDLVGTGNSQENLGHKVIIQVKWIHSNQQFEGKHYVRTRLRQNENRFIIRYEGV